MNTVEVTVYEQTINGFIKLYCEDCKPTGKSKKGTLRVSGYDHFCSGCGEDFKVIGEQQIALEMAEQAAWDNHQMGY